MLMIHEFDRKRWSGKNEPDQLHSDPTDTGTGDDVADWIIHWNVESKKVLPPDAGYLGLASGHSASELQFAHLLNITPQNITLVDKYFKPKTRRRIESEHPEVSLIDSGIFEYLENPQRRDYSFVTAFGIEYVLEDPRIAETFISQVKTVLRVDGIVSIFPYVGTDPSLWFYQNDFTPINNYTVFDGNGAMLIYRYKGEDNVRGQDH